MINNKHPIINISDITRNICLKKNRQAVVEIVSHHDIIPHFRANICAHAIVFCIVLVWQNSISYSVYCSVLCVG